MHDKLWRFPLKTRPYLGLYQLNEQMQRLMGKRSNVTPGSLLFKTHLDLSAPLGAVGPGYKRT